MFRLRTLRLPPGWLTGLLLMGVAAAARSETPRLPLPNVWGEGQRFVFSALSGPTKFDEPFHASLLGDRLGIALANAMLLPHQRAFGAPPVPADSRALWVTLRRGRRAFERLPGRGPDSFDYHHSRVVATDVLDSTVTTDSLAVTLRLAFADRSTLRGEVVVTNAGESPQRCTLQVRTAFDGQNEPDDAHPRGIVQRSAGISSALVFEPPAGVDEPPGEVGTFELSLAPRDVRRLRFAYTLWYGDERPSLPSGSFEDLFERRLEPLLRLRPPGRYDEGLLRLYAKAYSELRGNTESPSGLIKTRWTTPDRVPHRRLWLWDSAFHALGIAAIDPRWAEDALMAVLESQREDGFISHMISPEGRSDVTQPPLLSWAVWDVYRVGRSQGFLRDAYPRLVKFQEWYTAHRDRNGDGLLEWVSGIESGMDNSPRFDAGADFNAVDYNAYAALDLWHLELIAEALGRSADATRWREKRRALARLINERLWDESAGLYLDRPWSGIAFGRPSIASFTPLLAEIAPAARARSLVRALKDETRWWTPLPGPSVPRGAASFGANMWRGPVWINFSYMLYGALKRNAEPALAHSLARRTIREIAKWYPVEGAIYEFYDPLGQTPPTRLPRKSGYGAIRDYGWSCALLMRLMQDEGEHPF